MSNPLDVATKRLVNDRIVFPFLYDQSTHSNMALFDGKQWDLLRAAFLNGDFKDISEKVHRREEELKREAEGQPQRDKTRAKGRNPHESTVELAESFVQALDTAPATLKFLFDTFESFGCLETALPNMEDFGKVAEFEPVAKLRHFFLYKIEKSRFPRERNALKRVLREVDYLLAEGCDTVDLGFFLRKLEDLRLLPEVIVYERQHS